MTSTEVAQTGLDALTSHIAVLDSLGTIVAVNRAWRAFAEANGSAPEWVREGFNYLEACEHDGGDGRVLAALMRSVLAGETAEGTHEYPIHGPGVERWFLCRITRIPESNPPKFVVAHEEITASKRAERELRIREEQLLRQRNALVALAGNARLNEEGIAPALHHITESASLTMGVSRVSVWRFEGGQTAIHCLDLFDANSASHTSAMLLEAKDYPVYFRALTNANIISADDAMTDPLTEEFALGYFPAFGISSMLDAPIHLGGALYGVLCHEHTGERRHWSPDEKTFAVALAGLVALALEEWDRRQAEEQLRLHSAALKATNNGIVITDLSGTITWANPAFSAISGYSPAEAIGRNPRDLVKSGQHPPKFFENLWSTILSGQVWRGTLINRRKDGSHYHEYQTISPIRDSAGAITHFVAVKEDVSEKIRVEATLQEARERLQRAVTAGNVGLWEWDLETGGVVYSAEWLAQAGLEADDDGQTMEAWFRRVHPDDIGPLRQTLNACTRAPDQRFQKEFRIGRDDGDTRWLLLGAAAVTDTTGRPTRVIGTNMDITERKRLEMQFQQAQKMESIGRLAGGVAHDFNNLLGVIVGYSELMLTTLGVTNPLQESLMQIKRAADRATGLTRQLLAFSRRQILRPAVVDLNGIIGEAEKMLRRLIGEDFELYLDLQPGLGRVLADPGQVEQILMNLVVNARDAMPRGGRISVITRDEVLDERQARQRPGGHPGSYTIVEVRDSGLGMDQRTQARIFEPFFTTKEMGTGLGLATVYGIVKQSGGNIWVESEPGKGSSFQIYLPRIDLEHLEVLAPGPADETLFGSGTILLAEDEEALRAVMELTLLRAGYNVIAAVDGTHALELMASYDGVIDLIVTDVVMPGLSGPEFVERAASQFPSVKVLYMSGYADDAIVHHGVLGEGIAFINKPFLFAQLNRQVREVLGRS